MDVLNWNAIFEKAKESLLPIKPQKKGSGIKRSGEGIKQGAGIKRGGGKRSAGVKRSGTASASSTRSVQGGNRIYPCFFCKAMGYQGKSRSPERLITHLQNAHQFNKANSEKIQKQWNDDSPVQAGDPDYKKDEAKLPELKSKVIPRQELIDAAKSDKGTKTQNLVSDSIAKALGEVKPEDVKEAEVKQPEVKQPKVKKPKKTEPVVPPAPDLPPELAAIIKTQKTIKSVKKKETAREKKLLEEANKPEKEPGIADLMKLMKAQKGDLPPEQKTELADLGKATVRKIKSKEVKSKASKADAKVIDTKFKELKKSKVKRVPAVEMKVKGKGKGKPILVLS